MPFFEHIKNELNITYGLIKNMKWFLSQACIIGYYCADLIGQTLADDAVIQEFLDYKNKAKDEDDLQFNTAMKLGICLSLTAAIPFTLTVISVARAKNQFSHNQYEHSEQNFFVKAIVLITRPTPFFALVYGSTNQFMHMLIKNKKITTEIPIQFFCITLSVINAENRRKLHTHHANATQSYFTLLSTLPLRKKIKGLLFTTALALAHGFEGWFEVGFGLDAVLNTAIFFGLPKYLWLSGLVLLANAYFSGSMLIDATRTEGRSILLKMLQEDEHQPNHWFTNIWLLLARIPHGLMPALGAIEFANLLYCMFASEFEHLTPECPNNLTDGLAILPKMALLGLTSLLIGYGAAEGFNATCRESTDQFVRHTDKTVRRIAKELKTKIPQCYANFFSKKKEEDIELLTLSSSSTKSFVL